MLLAGVVAWEALAAVALLAGGPGAGRTVARPGLRREASLWATFILLDEMLLIFETGAEATHLRLLIAQLLTLILAPARRTPRRAGGSTQPRG